MRAGRMAIARRAAILVALCAMTVAIGALVAPRPAPRGRGDAADAIVLLLRDEQEGHCSGVLVEHDLVVTARHCLSRVGRGRFGCREDGTRSFYVGESGRYLGDELPETIAVYAGSSWPTAHAVASARGVRTSHDGASLVCGHDVGFLHLSRAIGRRVSLRSAPTTPGESLSIVGFGVNERGERPAERHVRATSVLRVGPSPATREADALAAGEIEVSGGACAGDSGGAVLDRDGALVGIVSRGTGDRAVAHGPECGGPRARVVVALVRKWPGQGPGR